MKNAKCLICKSNKNVRLWNNKMLLCSKHIWHMERYGEILERTVYDKNEIIIHNDCAEIILYNRENEPIISTLIDLEDVDKVKDYKWRLNNHGYVVSGLKGNDKGRVIFLHNLIFQSEIGKLPDHINRIPLDNRKCNLRNATEQENRFNKSIQSNNTSGIAGVTWDKARSKWSARIQLNGKNLYLGRFENIEDAIQARKEAEVKYFGEFAPIN